MRGIFFYTASVAFAVGVFLRSFLQIDHYGIICLVLLGIAFLVLFQRYKNVRQAKRRTSPFLVVALALFAVSLGVLRVYVEEQDVSPLHEKIDSEVVLEGVIVREPDEREQSIHLYTEVADTDEIILVIVDPYHMFSYGDRIRAVGTLELPEAFETDLGRTFNYPGYLKAHDVRYTLPFAEVEVLARDRGNPFLASLLDAKRTFTSVIEGIIPEPQVGLGEGLLLGMKRALGEDLEEAFRVTGIIHIVVLSGYNVMLVAEAIMRLLSFLFAMRVRMVLGVAAITTFALLVGLSATVVRASIMASLVLIARATGRTYTIVRALVIAGLIMLLVNPYLLAFDPGFQLSFLATLGLIFLAPAIETRLKLVPTKFQIREFVTATVSTQIFVAPLLLYLMGSISIVAVTVNVLVLPAVPVAMLLTFATGIIGLANTFLGSVPGLAAHLVLTYIIRVAEFFASFSFAALDVAFFPFWLALLMYAGIGFMLYRIYTQKTTTPEPALVQKAQEDAFDLSDWVIEVEEEKSADHRRWSADSFPFR